LKRFFPGDADFTYNSFVNLPYEYALQAYEEGSKMHQITLHENERPIALLASLIANTNRDPKKKLEPYALTDFYLYQPREFQDLPSGRYGSAALALIQKRLFPSWGLTFYSQLSAGASGEEPTLLAFIGKDFLLLAPAEAPGGYTGMLLALESANKTVQTAYSPCGKSVTFLLPEVKSKVIAEEDYFLSIKN
jgi:hypothetical protein